jgi:membrane fusion protein, multidrug efflux system
MKKLAIAVAAGVVVAAGLAAITAVPQLRASLWPEVKAADAPPAAPAPGVPVTAGAVEAKDVPVFLNGIGTVQALNMVQIRSRVDGQIVAINYTEGQEVKSGDQLVQIDPRPYKAALDAAQANLEKDQANLANAQVNYQRDAQIVTNNLAVSRQQFDQDKANLLSAQGQVDSDKAQVETARLNLEYSSITAPFDGRLSARLVDIGNLVHATDVNPLVTITQVKPLFVSFTLAQENLDAIRDAQANGALDVIAYSGDNKRELSHGKLTLIDNSIDQATGTIHMKATFANEDERLWPGEFVNVRLVLSTRKDVATVPQQTVQVGPNGYYAYIIKPDNTVERRAVDVAALQDGIAVINKGLNVGEKVVVDGQFRLTEGARVRILDAGASG